MALTPVRVHTPLRGVRRDRPSALHQEFEHFLTETARLTPLPHEFLRKGERGRRHTSPNGRLNVLSDTVPLPMLRTLKTIGPATPAAPVVLYSRTPNTGLSAHGFRRDYAPNLQVDVEVRVRRGDGVTHESLSTHDQLDWFEWRLAGADDALFVVPPQELRLPDLDRSATSIPSVDTSGSSLSSKLTKRQRTKQELQEHKDQLAFLRHKRHLQMKLALHHNGPPKQISVTEGEDPSKEQTLLNRLLRAQQVRQTTLARLPTNVLHVILARFLQLPQLSLATEKSSIVSREGVIERLSFRQEDFQTILDSELASPADTRAIWLLFDKERTGWIDAVEWLLSLQLLEDSSPARIVRHCVSVLHYWFKFAGVRRRDEKDVAVTRVHLHALVAAYDEDRCAGLLPLVVKVDDPVVTALRSLVHADGWTDLRPKYPVLPFQELLDHIKGNSVLSAHLLGPNGASSLEELLCQWEQLRSH